MPQNIKWPKDKFRIKYAWVIFMTVEINENVQKSKAVETPTFFVILPKFVSREKYLWHNHKYW